MATYAELKTRIITEMVRDDLEDDLATQLTTHIARACEYYANERFWFNAIVVDAACTSGTEVMAIPATVRRIDRLTIPELYREVIEVTLPEYEKIISAANSAPTRYAYYNDSIRLYPTPDAAYTLRFTGLAEIAAPTADADENAWTTEAQDLIVAHTKMTLSRDQFRDPDGVQLFTGAVQDALHRLKRETAQRLVAPLRPLDGRWQRQRFNWLVG